MARLVYSVIASLDGYVADRDGRFDWAEPDPEVHGFVNDLERHVGTHLYGRRTYEEAATPDLTIGGPALAAHAIDAGLLDERRFASGVVYLRHRAR